MNRNSCRAAPAVLFALALLSVHLPASAGAGEIPPSAYSQSLLVPGVFLDHENLVYQFPHRAAQLPSEILTSTIGSGYYFSGNTAAVGANIRLGRQAFFLLSQETEPFTWPVQDYNEQRIRAAQGGWATTAGPLTAGLALRGGRLREADEGTQTTSLGERIREQTTTVDYREGAAGIGYASERFRLDLVFEIYLEDFESHSFLTTEYDTARVDIVPEDVILTSSVIRVELPVGERSILTIAGGYRETSSAFQVKRAFPTSTSVGPERTYGHLWQGGLCLRRELNEAGVGRLHAYYANTRRTSLLGDASYYSEASLSRVEWREETVACGFSLERPVWWSCTLLTGFRNSFTFQEEAFSEEMSDDETRTSDDVTETLQQSFAWGLSRMFRRLSLTAAVETDLQVFDPFISLDARLFF